MYNTYLVDKVGRYQGGVTALREVVSMCFFFFPFLGASQNHTHKGAKPTSCV